MAAYKLPSFQRQYSDRRSVDNCRDAKREEHLLDGEDVDGDNAELQNYGSLR